jgi:hypothetical protein
MRVTTVVSRRGKEMAEEVQAQTITADSYAELKAKLDDQTEKGWRAIRVTVRQVGYAIDLELRSPLHFPAKSGRTKSRSNRQKQPRC